MTKTSKLKKTGTVGKRNTGTRIHFWPEKKYFDSVNFSLPRLKHVLRAKAVLCPGLKVSFVEEKTAEKEEWCYEGGLADYLCENLFERDCMPAEPFIGSLASTTEAVDWALTWQIDAGELSYVEVSGRYQQVIDDVIAVILDDGEGCERGAAASLLAIHAVCRPVAADEPILRDELTAEKKLIAESLLEELKTTLGWALDTRRLLVGLSDEKLQAWLASVIFMLIVGYTSYAELDTLVGRLNHVCFVVPQARHFMSRLRILRDRSRAGFRIPFRPQVLADLRLWCSFLRLAHRGIDMNLISFRRPTHVLRTDASEHGIGGFCARSGRAYTFEIPPDCRVGCRAGISLNLFEFLGSIVSVWLEILAGDVPRGSCILAQGDSTSATGWLRKSNFPEHSHPLQLEAARHLAHLVLDAGACLYSQWFPGKENGVADCLSRDTHLSDENLTNLCHSYLPEQMPPNFAICPLPPAISSWLTSLLRSQPPAPGLRKQPTRSTIWRGHVGRDGSRASSWSTTSTWRLSLPGPGLVSLELSAPPCEQLAFQDRLSTSLQQAQSPIPSIMWRRPLWRPDRTTLDTSPESLHAFYSASSADTATSTGT